MRAVSVDIAVLWLAIGDAEGQAHRVPFHRVREVYKDGQRIWHRRQDAK